MDVRTRTARPADGATALWELAYLDKADSDARKVLDGDQYAHVIGLFDLLATEQNPRVPQTVDVRPIDAFYELRDKGGILGKLNIRVYFAVFDRESLVLVLGCRKKEQEKKTPPYVITTMRNRLRYAKRALEIGDEEAT